MRRPLRNRLHTIADLAIAFATLEAVRLPEPRNRGGHDRRPDEAPRCTSLTPCATAARRRAEPARPRTPRIAHR